MLETPQRNFLTQHHEEQLLALLLPQQSLFLCFTWKRIWRSGFMLSSNFLYFHLLRSAYIPEIISAISQTYWLLFCLTGSKNKQEAQWECMWHVCMWVCVLACVYLSECACSSGNNMDCCVSDQLLWLIWPVSVNHFCHLIDVTPVWKMSTTLTGRWLGLCWKHWQTHCN